MGTSTARKRTHVVLPADLVAKIDELVGARGRSRFIAEAAEQRLQLERQRRALEIGFGAWKDEDHPELNGPDGTVGWVRRTREISLAAWKNSCASMSDGLAVEEVPSILDAAD